MSENPLSEKIIEIVKKIALNNGIKDPKLTFEPACEPGENYVGDITRVKIYSSKESDRSMSFIAKTKIGIHNSDLNNVYENEINCFKYILPELIAHQDSLLSDEKFVYSNFYGGKNEEEKYIIMEDLCAKGFKKIRKKECFDEHHLAVIIRTFAHFHATSFVLKLKNPDLFKKFTAMLSLRELYSGPVEDVGIKCKENLLALITDLENNKRFKNFLKDKTVNNQVYWRKEVADPYNVIVHGDCWSGNFLFRYKDNVVVDGMLLDWQTVMVASPITDLLSLIFLVTDYDVRSKCLLRMFDYYYEVLSSNITKMGGEMSLCYPKEVYENHLNKIMPIGLLAAIVNLPILFADKGFTPNLDDCSDADWYLVKYSETFIERFKGIVKSYLEFGYM